MDDIAIEWDVYQQNCPTRLLLTRVADKWVLLILGILEKGPERFNALRRKLEGISQKSLTEALRTLEQDGLVARHVITVSPIAVQYSITPLGETLARAAEPLRIWAQSHMEEVLLTRETFRQD